MPAPARFPSERPVIGKPTDRMTATSRFPPSPDGDIEGVGPPEIEGIPKPVSIERVQVPLRLEADISAALACQLGA